MMTERARASVCRASVIFFLLLMGCTEEAPPIVTPTPPVPTPNLPPTELQAYSASASSVGLLWKLSESEADSTFQHYAIETRDSNNVSVSTHTVPGGTFQTVIGGLRSGNIYTFSIRSRMAGRGLSTEAATIRWSPAFRLTNADSLSGPPIQLYESSTASQRSGLQFYDDSAGTARVHSLRAENPRRGNADIYLSTAGTGGLAFASINTLGAGYPRVTTFSTVSSDADNLSDPKGAPPATSTYILSSVTVPSNQVSLSKIFYARSVTDNKYVRILVRRNGATGLLYFENPNGTNRYVLLELSYQNMPGNQYARPVLQVSAVEN